MDLEHERRLAEVEARSKSNTIRLNKLEESTETLNRLATSVEVMAQEQRAMTKSVDTLSGKVEALEQEPAKKWRFVVEKAIYFVVAAIVGFALAKIGL